MNKLLISTILYGVCTQKIQAATLSLDFNSLPSAQGWSYVGALSEGAVYSASSSVLTQNTIGGGSGYGWYELPGAIDINSSFSLSFTGRVFQEEGALPVNSFAFGASLGFDSQVFLIGLGANRILSTTEHYIEEVTTSIDTSQSHSYFFTGQPYTHTWQLSVDGTQVGAGIARQDDLYPNLLAFGDLTGGPNASGEWTQFFFTQTPEPSSALLLLSGALLCLRGRSLRTYERNA